MNNSLYWKLQSVNNTDMIEVGSEEFNIYREKFKKNFETRELMSEEETLIHYNYNAYKNPLFSRIYSLTLAFVDGETLRVKYLTGSEKDLLQTFLNEVKGKYFKDFQLTHSDAEYMLPYLGTRLDIHGFRTSLHKDLIYKGLRPWNLSGCSVRDYYQGAGAYKHSLKEIAWVYGLKTDYIELADEFNFYKKGNFKALKNSAVNEIQTLVNVHRLMMGENVVNDLSVSEQKVEAVVEVEQPILTELYNSKQFNDRVKEYLTGLKILKKDKEIVKRLVLAHYLEKIEVTARNKKELENINKERTEEVNLFFKTL